MPLSERGRKKGAMRRIRLVLDRNRLGELLVSGGMITPQQLRFALARSRPGAEPLGVVLLRERMIHRHQLYQALVQQWVMRFLLAAMTVMLAVAAFQVRPAKASSIGDIPAQVRLVTVANAAFGAIESYQPLFGAQERRSANLRPFTKWTSMFDRFERDMQSRDGQKIMDRFKTDIAALEGLPLTTMAERVDKMFNRVPYISDQKNWGISDYWSTPVEFMQRGGDCEDYAIAKYVALRSLGVHENRLRIAIVHDLQKDIPHAVLIVYADDGAMILDNQSQRTRFVDDVNRYRPIFSINRTAWWLHTAPGDAKLAFAASN